MFCYTGVSWAMKPGVDQTCIFCTGFALVWDCLLPLRGICQAFITEAGAASFSSPYSTVAAEPSPVAA